MQVGLLTVLFAEQTLENVIDYIKEHNVHAIELGTGNYPNPAHCDLGMLENDTKLSDFKKLIADKGMTISSLSCHGNPLHPNEEIAKANRDVERKTVLLAEKLGIERVNNFSGCPGDSPAAKYPNWVTCYWPPDYPEILDWQWNEVVIPYWKEQGKFAADHGVKWCFEMHPGFVVYSPETLLRLREAVGPVIGTNFDPSHLFWQGIDPLKAIRNLGDSIYHVHAKDTKVYEANSEVNGVLDNKPYTDEVNRSWIFRTVGYGHGAGFWADFVSTLRMVGYDWVLSIEHEDSLMSNNEGFAKAADFLNNIIIREKAGEAYWA